MTRTPGWVRSAAWIQAAIGAVAVADVAHQVRVWPGTAVATAPQAIRQSRRGVDIAELQMAHLFGAPPVDQRLDSGRPDSHRTFVLTGVVATSDPSVGYAILGPQGQATRLYHAGGALGGGGTLYEVFEDHVVLIVAGRREILRLRKFHGGTGVLLAASTEPATEDAEEAPQQDTADNTPMEQVSLTESLFGRFNYGRYNGPGGKFAGVKLLPVPADRAQFGLNTGDVVTAINGVRVTDEDTLNSILKKADGPLNLTIARGGSFQNITVSVDE